MIHVLLLQLFLGLPGLREDCAQCSPAALCAVHQGEQSAAIKEVKPKLKAKEPSERLAALKKLAQVNAEHPSVPSLEIAELVAAGTRDESYVVKTGAARLLASLHPDVAVRTLVQGLEEARKELAKLPGGRYDGQADEKDPRIAEQKKLREEVMQYMQASVEGLGKLPDDRCVEALAELLPQLTRRNGGDLIAATAEGLLAFDARAGVAAIIVKIKASPVGGGGGRWGPDTTGQTLHEMLAKKAAAKGLTEVPPWSDKEPPDWEKWFTKNQKPFAAKLGKYDLAKMRAAKS